MFLNNWKIFSVTQGCWKNCNGYANGTTKKTNYRKVYWGLTTHADPVEVVYDLSVINLEELVHHLF